LDLKLAADECCAGGCEPAIAIWFERVDANITLASGNVVGLRIGHELARTTAPATVPVHSRQ